MRRDWQPGDVAMVVNTAGEEKVARFTGKWGDLIGEDHWSFADGSHLLPREVTQARPLVVIDPEDIEAVREIWVKSLLPLDQFQAHLREFASPTPPRPDEPLGLGAVVEDADGKKWVHANPDGINSWMEESAAATSLTRDYWRAWSDISAVRILSEGVTP